MSDNGRVILYIEDNPDNRSLVRRVLSAEGYTVLEAPQASQAFLKLESENIDLILMDINMPDMDGYTLTAKIKQIEKYKHIPIVAITANVMRGDKEKSLEAGCDGYIQKPIDIDLLSQQVERYISRRSNV
ncbi:MAG: response regulator [Anaerolineales bacterium]|nr:response regulator [Anaerolineales bacterium]